MKWKGITHAYVRRYGTVALLSIFVLTGLFYVQPRPVEPASATAPTQAQITQAVVLEQGVYVAWQPSQAGSHPVAGYVLERRKHHEYEKVAQIEAWVTNYLDPDGQPGDAYRVIAQDSQQKPMHSGASDPAIAALAKPGDGVVVSSPQVLGVSEIAAQATSTAEKVLQLNQGLSKQFTALDQALGNHAEGAVPNHLNTLQTYQQQALAIWPQLSSAQKRTFAQTCSDNLSVFETNLHRIAEADQLDGMIVLAGCNALREVAT